MKHLVISLEGVSLIVASIDEIGTISIPETSNDIQMQDVVLVEVNA